MKASFILHRYVTLMNLFHFSDKVQALVYSSGTKQLLSVGDDKVIAIWNMDCKRVEVRDFARSTDKPHDPVADPFVPNVP